MKKPSSGSQGDFWPSPERELLLRSALLKGDSALSAWEALRPTIDIDVFDDESVRMLPLLYRNLANHEYDDSLMPRLKGLYKQTWYKNQILFHAAGRAIAALQQKGISPIVLKGAALTTLYYCELGVRPMRDLDLFVHPGRSSEAIEIMKLGGWKPRLSLPPPPLRFVHGIEMKLDDENRCDLHWQMTDYLTWKRADGAPGPNFMDGCVPLEIGGAEAEALDPSATLIHVCVHGARWGSSSSLRWIADAFTIATATDPAPEWERTLGLARRYGAVLPLRDAMTYLADTLSVPLPDGFLNGLRNSSPRLRERIGYRATARTPLGPEVWQTITRIAAHYLRVTADLGPVSTLVAIPRFLRESWLLSHWWQLPVAIVRKSFRRIFGTNTQPVTSNDSRMPSGGRAKL